MLKSSPRHSKSLTQASWQASNIVIPATFCPSFECVLAFFVHVGAHDEFELEEEVLPALDAVVTEPDIPDMPDPAVPVTPPPVSLVPEPVTSLLLVLDAPQPAITKCKNIALLTHHCGVFPLAFLLLG